MDTREYMVLQGRIAALEAQVEFLYKHLNLTFSPEQSFSDPRMAKIYDLVAQGKMLEAIQAHRQTFNSSLADAKAAVENLRGQVK
jgi:ribosomal protein L7/L12